MRPLLASTGSALGILAACVAPPRVGTSTARFPEGWRAPTAAETTQPFRDESPEHYLRAIADFDGDGRADRAVLLVSEASRKMALFVFLTRSGDPETYQLYAFDDPAFIEVMGIDVAKPGSHRVTCDNDDNGRCGPDGKKPVVLNLPAIDSFKEGSASSLFYWKRDARSFQQLWTSD